MKSSKLRLYQCGFAFLLGMLLMCNPMKTVASEGDSLGTLNAGAAVILEADISMTDEELEQIVKQAEEDVKKEKEAEASESKLVMANVNNSVNIRAEADEDAEKLGKLYKDCGGQLLERSNGWSKIESGGSVGWVKDKYLLFGADAEKLANDVGRLIATVNADGLRIRKEQSEDSGIYAVVALNETLDAIEEKNGWVAVDYEGNTGYLSAEYVTVEFQVDEGETMEAIKERERKEAEEKAKLKKNNGAVLVEASDLELLGALIQCEAGGEPYEGQVAVGAVVMNRVRHPAYPNTVQGVIYASGQFTPALNGKVAVRLQKGVKESCIQAAQEAINGATNVGDLTHFRRAGNKEGVIIGNHVFY